MASQAMEQALRQLNDAVAAVTTAAAQAPEAMWVGWPETPEGGLALEGRHLLHERISRASALVMGPGMGKEPETLTLAKDVVQSATIPLLLDADALQPDIVRAGKAPRVLTPHRGEFMRILAGGDFREFQKASDAVVVLKGRLTGITQQERGYYSLYGGPVLARGGSGDCLAGIVGTQLEDDQLRVMGGDQPGQLLQGIRQGLAAAAGIDDRRRRGENEQARAGAARRAFRARRTRSHDAGGNRGSGRNWR